MIIHIQEGCGEGSTSRAAFDAALHGAGIDNYNLIHLSSVIPAGTVVERDGFQGSAAEIGHRLYVVLAHAETSQPGKEVWAGLGWVQDRNERHGLFVEFIGETRERLEAEITISLEEMMTRRCGEYGPIQCALVKAVCRDRPAAAVVVGVYRAEGWE